MSISFKVIIINFICQLMTIIERLCHLSVCWIIMFVGRCKRFGAVILGAGTVAVAGLSGVSF